MGEMIGNIAHQWRQPINALGLILADLEDAYLHGELDGQYLHGSVDKSAAIIRSMSQTIDDFRNFFRSDKAAGEFGLLQASQECLSLVDATMQDSRIEVVVDCEHEVAVWGYQGEFHQALMNLLMNAKDAIVENDVAGRVEIHIYEQGPYGVISVTDNGGGIPEEVIAKVFDPYFTTKQQGVGLGLYMSRVAVVDHMQGQLQVQNIDHGAQFSVYLPLPEYMEDAA